MIDAYLQVGDIKGESQLGPELGSVIAGLARVAGCPVPEAAPQLSISFESARATALMSKRWCA
ncbi:hypothetical protein [Massilia rhizosphaerae]|uniref:hypothetical protein n=1 Tax=Massilia rhizosphaerae TaxID=2784389 RepID=UPI0018DCB78D|nr:hypothetical protein [Massilia rhizosphaerae]